MATSLLITAIASSTLTAAGHGLNTGDGPVDVRAGVGGVIPSPLVAGTDYWAIKLDANNVQLATSNANALANTFITLSGGSGKLFLEYGIPYRRKTTYAALSQVKSADLDSLQDSLKALHALLTGQAQSIWTGQAITHSKFPTIAVATNWGAVATDAGGNSNDPAIGSSGAGAAFIDLDVPVGYKLATLTLAVGGNSSANVTLQIDKSAIGYATNTGVGALTVTAPVLTPADITMNMLATTPAATVTVAAAGGTYTRSVGSFITDGFFQGQVVQWAGFVNGGNNALKTITALSATVMTVSNTGLVNETGPTLGTSVNGVSPTVDATMSLQLRLTASATGISAKSLRYTVAPQ